MALDERKISLCIPTYNRYKLLINSFINVLADERVDEIIISDDCSSEDNYEKVKSFVSGIQKIKLFRNESNQDCYKNKYTSLTYAKNQYAILFDSDNTLTKEYIDKIFNIADWSSYAAMLPSFAQPHFDYRKYSGHEITKSNVAGFSHDSTFTTALNTANYFVNKDFYIKCWDESINPNTADSIYMNYRMIDNGGKLYIVPDLFYHHRVDDHKDEQAGHYVTNQHKTGVFHDDIIQRLRNMR